MLENYHFTPHFDSEKHIRYICNYLNLVASGNIVNVWNDVYIREACTGLVSTEHMVINLKKDIW